MYKDLIARMMNNGPFQYFFTLSCGDTRWNENFKSVLHNLVGDNKIIYRDNEVYIDNNREEKPLRQYLADNESIHDFIRVNILTATRNFDHRVKAFISNVILGTFSPMQVKYYSYRVEFQLRGAGHIHGCLWVDFKNFWKLLSQEDKNSFRDLGVEDHKCIESTFDAFGEEKQLDGKVEKNIMKYIDKFITVSLKNPRTRDIVKEVNVHHHTKACLKFGHKNCRFQFPTFPSCET